MRAFLSEFGPDVGRMLLMPAIILQEQCEAMIAIKPNVISSIGLYDEDMVIK